MRLILRGLTLAALALSLASCASYFKRKKCEKTNWFEHGHSVAMKGQRVDQDSFVKTCEKVEAEINHQDLDLGFKKGMSTYCEPKTVYGLGKKGEFFNKSMCDGPGQRKLLAKHAAGVVVFCKPRNGFKVGASGVVYNKICPEKLEAQFMVQYEKGRAVYLRQLIADKREEVRSKEITILRKENERDRLSDRVARFRIRRVPVRRQVMDERSQRIVERVTYEDDPESTRRKRQLEDELRRTKREISEMRDKQDQLRSEIKDHRRELNSLSGSSL